MAQLIAPVGIDPAGYRGLASIFQYTNWDGDMGRFNCGQAAAATFLTFQGVFPPSQEQAQEIMRGLERERPPDILGGWFGTSRRQIEHICRQFGHELTEINGEESLRNQLDRQQPVIVMLGVPGPKLFKRYVLPAGHWTVAYGYDEVNIHLTNWGAMSWPDFRTRWNSMVSRLISMRQRGLTRQAQG
jgi:hypothetical protein